MKRKWVWALALAFSLLTLHGCVPLRPYWTTQAALPAADGSTLPPQQKPSPSCPLGTSCISYAEYDEFGHPFNRQEIDDAVGRAQATAKNKGVIVVFVHGWHHNASEEDTNRQEFVKEIAEVADIDGSQEGGKFHRTIQGIYVGWRGESIDSNHWYSLPASVLTFWERKNTAHAVGDGGIFELFERLAMIRNNNPDSRLVIIGHSFGAAVVYTALSHKFFEQVLKDPSASAPVEQQRQSRKDWDLVLLINSAFEATRVRSQFEMARLREYGSEQIPHLVFVTSEADDATRIAFPLGRDISTVFDTYPDGDDAESKMNVTAIGHYIPMVTHMLSPAPSCQKGEALNDTTSTATLESTKSFCFNDPRAFRGKSLPLLLIRCDEAADCAAVAPGHYIRKGSVDMGLTPDRMPLLNIRTTGDVMTGHNDIWNDNMQGFITEFVILAASQPGAIPMMIAPQEDR